MSQDFMTGIQLRIQDDLSYNNVTKAHILAHVLLLARSRHTLNRIKIYKKLVHKNVKVKKPVRGV